MLTARGFLAGGFFIGGRTVDREKQETAAVFPLKGVIAGWTEALQLMAAGSRYQLFIPSELAYGAQGAGPEIGPNATFAFEVELLAIK